MVTGIQLSRHKDYNAVMIKALVSDFSRVLLFPKDNDYQGSLNELHKKLSSENNYNPLDHFLLNNELLQYCASLRSKVDLYLFTSDVIQDAPAFQNSLRPIFDKTYSASKMNTRKDNPNAYRQIVDDLKISPEEVLYIDDNAKNIEAAANAGLLTIHYRDNQDLQTRIQKIL
jgi:HAD superfamily hydrolase (TIGR01549 family)